MDDLEWFEKVFTVDEVVEELRWLADNYIIPKTERIKDGFILDLGRNSKFTIRVTRA